MLLIAIPIEKVQEIWPTKMDFGRPNAEIGWKMANGRLLFLALHIYPSSDVISLHCITHVCCYCTYTNENFKHLKYNMV